MSYRRGTAAYFIPKVFQNLLANIGFGATLSALIQSPLASEELVYPNSKYYGND